MRLRDLSQSGPLVAMTIAVLVFGALVALRGFGVLEPAELYVYDRLLALRPGPAVADVRIVVVEYTERDIQEQREFPLSDARLADVVERVAAGGPRAIGLDIYRDVPVPPGSERLDALLASEPRVVMINRFGGDGLLSVPPPRVLAGSDRVGFSDLKLDSDDAVRRAILYQQDDESGTGLSLALRVALLWLRREGIGLGIDPDDEESLRLGETTLPRLDGNAGGYADADSGGYQILIDYRGAPARFTSTSVGELLRGDVPPDLFRDRIVLVGVTAETHADFIHVPFGAWPGVDVHAHIASQLVRHGLGESAPPHALGELAEVGWILAWALAGTALGFAVRSATTFGAAALVGLAALAGAAQASLSYGLWIPATAPALAWLASSSLVTAWISRRERAQRAVLMNLFARNVNEKVAEALWAQRDAFLDGGRPRPQRVMATVLFADIRGSTGLGEKLEPLVFMEWLNDFMEAMADQVLAHGGIVDDYFGDGLKADFGVPIPRATEAEVAADAAAAVRCALALEAALVRLNAGWRARGLPAGAMRVGINTGTMIAGSVGSSDRLKYTVVGDSVVVAARLESFDASAHDFAKRPCRILVAESTRSRLGSAFQTRALGEFRLKGKDESIAVHEVLGTREADAAGGEA